MGGERGRREGGWGREEGWLGRGSVTCPRDSKTPAAAEQSVHPSSCCSNCGIDCPGKQHSGALCECVPRTGTPQVMILCSGSVSGKQ